MVKKLFKHEYLFYARVMVIIYGILLTIATATRIIFAFESDTTAYQIISTFSIILYAISVFAAIGFSFVMGIVRFYKNFFTSEGYLSFTLPVTTSQHIVVKATTAVSVNFVTWIVALLSVCIVTSGPVLKDIFNGLLSAFPELYNLVGIHAVLVGIEFAVIMLIAAFSSVMLYYTFICIGQLSKKNRILAAVGAYFAYYIASQVIATILTILLSVFAVSGAFEAFTYWIYQNPFGFIHITMCLSILIAAIFVLIEFMIIHKIITQKLNLE